MNEVSTGHILPAVNCASVLKAVFTPVEMEALFIEQDDENIWPYLPSTPSRITPEVEVMEALEARGLAETAQAIGRLGNIAAQDRTPLPLLGCGLIGTEKFRAHRDADPNHSWIRFLAVKSGSIKYRLGGKCHNFQHFGGFYATAEIGDVLCLNNTSYFPDTRPAHSGSDGSGQRFRVDFMREI